MRKLALLLLLAAIPAHAQVIQHKACEKEQTARFVPPCTFDKAVTPGDLIVVVGFGGCNPLLPYDGKCLSVSDSQANVWQTALIVPNGNGNILWYALDAKGGFDTVYFAQNTTWWAMIAEYPPSSGLDGVHGRTYSESNLTQPPGASNDVGWAGPVETSQAGDLIIAWGYNGALNACCGHVEAGPGFTIREFVAGNYVLEDSVAGVPGLYIAAVKWPGYAHWVLAAAFFKMKTISSCKAA